MFTIEGVTAAHNSADATARFWLMRASTGLSSGQIAFEAGLVGGVPDDQLTGNHGFAVLLNKAREVQKGGRRGSEEAGLAVARLSVAAALYVDLSTGLLTNPERVVAEGGIQYRKDHDPIGRLAQVLVRKNTSVVSSLPNETNTATLPELAYAKVEGEPYTVLHGDIDAVQAHLLEARGVPPADVVTLTSAQS